MAKLLQFGPAAFFYLLALAAQVSGYTSPTVAIILAALGTVWLIGSGVYHWHVYRFRIGKPGVDAAHLITVGLVGAASFLLLAAGGYVWQQYYSSVVSVIEASPAVAAPVTPKKFYAQSDKNRIGDALYDLSEILNKTGAAINQKTNQVRGIWDRQRTLLGQGRKPAVGEILKPLNEMRDLTAVFHRLLNDKDNGLLTKYESYGDELTIILNQDKNNNTLSALQIAANKLVLGLTLLEKFDDQRATGDMMDVLSTQIDNVSHAESDFSAWIISVKQRSDALRQSLAAG
jgi:hypothetical protein